MTERWDVAVIGAGLTGWAAAATAAGAGAGRVLVIDRGTPGRSATDLRDGFALNRGAHAHYPKGPGAEVLRRLGVRPEGTPPPLPGALASFEGRRGLLPMDAASLLRTDLLGTVAKAQLGRFLATLGRIRLERLAGLSTYEWLASLQLRHEAELVVRTMIRLTSYAADHAQLSADAAADQLRVATGGVLYLHGGWTVLLAQLRETALRLGVAELTATATSCQPDAEAITILGDEVGGAGALRATSVILATGSPHTDARLLDTTPPAWADLGPAAEASCLDLGFAGPTEVGVLLGMDKPLYAIRHSPPAQLAQPGGSVVHAVRYRTTGEELDAPTARAELEAHVRAAGGDPAAARVARYLHRIDAVSSIPTPVRGGLGGRPGVESSGLPGVLVAGDWVGPVGMLADAALTSAEAAGRVAAARAGRPTATQMGQNLSRAGTR